MGNHLTYLSEPDTDCHFEIGTGESYYYAAASMQGWRNNQEDRLVCISKFYDDCSFFGVYDGHQGFEIAEFLKQNLHLEVKHALQEQGDDIELALYLGFLTCDESIKEPQTISELKEMAEEATKAMIQKWKKHKLLSLEEKDKFSAGATAECSVKSYPEGNVSTVLKYLLSGEIEPSDSEDGDYDMEEEEESSEESSSSEGEDESGITVAELLSSEPGYLSGSTATVVIIRPKRIYVANVGDSRCVLSRKGRAVDMSVDHKPDSPEELDRILSAGGSVSENGRLANCLNLSRAFGDFKLKGDSSIPSEQSLTSEPFIKSVDIQTGDDFLIVASDGIWDSMSSQEVVDYINIRLQAGMSELKNICEEIFTFALAPANDNDGTGCDNMSCIIIKFDDKEKATFAGNAD